MVIHLWPKYKYPTDVRLTYLLMYFQREKEVVLFDFLPLRTNVALEMMVFRPKNSRNLVCMGAVGAFSPMLFKEGRFTTQTFWAIFLLQTIKISALVYLIIVQDEINMWDGKNPKIYKLTGWYKAMLVGIFQKILLWKSFLLKISQNW